ncbi:MAG: PilZ domain-containing protein [Nannocystales bacterium]
MRYALQDVMAFEDKRRTRRFDVQLALRVRRGDEDVTGMTQNLSLGGMLASVPFEPPLRLGDKVRVSFSVPQLSEPIEVDAEVRWTAGSGIGLQFAAGLRAKQTWALGKFLDSLGSGA